MVIQRIIEIEIFRFSAMKKLRKGKYKVTNWSEYNNSLKNRGDITFWLSEDALENQIEEDLVIKPRGRKIKYF